MNRLYDIVDEDLATTIGIVGNKEDIEYTIREHCRNEGKDSGNFFYHVFNVDVRMNNAWVPYEIYPICLYDGEFYYEGQTMPNGKVVS